MRRFITILTATVLLSLAAPGLASASDGPCIVGRTAGGSYRIERRNPACHYRTEFPDSKVQSVEIDTPSADTPPRYRVYSIHFTMTHGDEGVRLYVWARAGSTLRVWHQGEVLAKASAPRRYITG